jgi:hypothetical protein
MTTPTPGTDALWKTQLHGSTHLKISNGQKIVNWVHHGSLPKYNGKKDHFETADQINYVHLKPGCAEADVPELSFM